MSNYNSIEKIISAEILRTNEDNLVAKRICSAAYSGDIKKKGDSVTIVGLNDPTVYNYEGVLQYEEVDDYAATLFVDQDKAFSFKVKDIEELRSSIGIADSQLKRASYLLKEQVDKYVLSLGKEAFHTLPTVAISPANVLTAITDMKQKLEEENVPDGRTWLVVPPFVKAKLMLAGIKFQINNGVNGTGAIAFTDELGFDIFVSNQIPTESGGKRNMIAGSYSAIAYAEQVLETQVIDRMENSFDKAVRGRLVFGAKVVRPRDLVCCPVTNAPSGSL